MQSRAFFCLDCSTGSDGFSVLFNLDLIVISFFDQARKEYNNKHYNIQCNATVESKGMITPGAINRGLRSEFYWDICYPVLPCEWVYHR